MRTVNFRSVVRSCIRRFLDSVSKRTYQTQDGDTYVLDFEESKCPETGHLLEVTTWGFCYKAIPIPGSWEDLCKFRMKAELGILMYDEAVNQVARRFYRDIQRSYETRCFKAGMKA